MDVQQALKQNIIKVLDTARLAPSVHNAQPWRISLAGESIVVQIDKSHQLKHSDPTGRELIISLGIFCESITIAARPHGLLLKKASLMPAGAMLDFKQTNQKADVKALADISSLKTRCSDRSIFKPVKITRSEIAKLENSSEFTGVTVKVLTEPSLIEKVAGLTAKGVGLALSSPAFRKELSGYLTLPWSRRKRGISVRSLHIPLPLALVEPKFIRWGLGLKTEVKTEKKRWLSASAIIFITTSGDVGADWFCAGRAYLRASLAAEQLGLAQATSAATVEASTFHEDLEELLDTKQRLQSVIRLGRGSNRKIYSPRISAEELLAT